MRSVLEELWHGNIYPQENCLDTNKTTKELVEYIGNHHDSLCESLTDKQKEIFEKFNDCCAELAGINEREIFAYAFRLGARLAIEIMSFDTE